MKLVRILLYEGSENVIREHVKKCFVDAEHPATSISAVKIQEIFRSSSTAIVEHISVEEFKAEVTNAEDRRPSFGIEAVGTGGEGT